MPVSLPAKRLIFSGTGPIDRDYDDLRAFSGAYTATHTHFLCDVYDAVLTDLECEGKKMYVIEGRGRL